MDVESAPARAYFRFYAELNDHLPAEQKHAPLEKSFFSPSTVKDMIESFGIPHTEIELIVANGQSVDFGYLVRDQDRIAVYPIFESVDVTPVLRLRRNPLRDPKFILDVHLGKLAAYLRMLGFDTLYRSCYSDRELVKISSAEHRILLTRDRGLLNHSAITHGYWLRETDSRKQISEILERFDLARFIQPFTRCLACNGMLQIVAKKQVEASLPKRTAELYDEFRACSRCGRVYWKGSHYERMQRWVGELTSCARA